MEATVIFPQQLYPINTIAISTQLVVLVEHELFFTQFKFHFQKLMLHRASMRAYADELKSKGKDVRYMESKGRAITTQDLFAELKNINVSEVHIFHVCDDWLNRQVLDSSKRMNIRLTWQRGTDFILDESDFGTMAPKEHTYFLHHFYIAMRKKYGVLLDLSGKPIGGVWSHDAENRKKIPPGMVLPKEEEKKQDTYKDEAYRYIMEAFPAASGIRKPLLFPYCRREALDALQDFCDRRFRHYGDYQDAMIQGQSFLFHSVLSPAINIGVLMPDEVIQFAVDYAEQIEIPINHVEGFVRQILGWREYIRMIYLRSGRIQRTRNSLGHTRKLPVVFWTGGTGIVPIDDVIKKTLETGYAHHIERLMILGNFMLLCEFDPNEVYNWFMALYIDAYDWVMVPNIYGMSQFADGGMMSTKPYVSGSNYILKMSNYQKGRWTDIWDGLFWRFVDRQKTVFLSGGRTNFIVSNLQKMPEEKRRSLFAAADEFIDILEK